MEIDIKEVSNLIKKIKVSKNLYSMISSRYSDIGKWLNRENSTIKQYNPIIYPQGSVRIGTLIKPIAKSSYDVDLVCELSKNISIADCSAYQLKEKIGCEIKLYQNHKNIRGEIVESKRCWTLNYFEEVPFHIDILPAISYKNFTEIQNVIAITDNTFKNYKNITNEWILSNPIEYSNWFNKIDMDMLERSNKSKKLFDLLPIPKFIEDDSIFKVILMMIKRHRDIFFNNFEEIKTPSILITTLACIAYKNTKTPTSLKTLSPYWMLPVISNHLENFANKSGEYIVKNPNSNSENFADKINLNDDMKKGFKDWTKQLNKDVLKDYFFLKLDK